MPAFWLATAPTRFFCSTIRDSNPYAPDTTAAAIAEMVQERGPWGLLVPASEHGRDWAPRLAARLGLGLTGDAIGLDLDREHRMVALKPAFGGNIVAPILCRTDPQMVTVRPGMLELGQPDRFAPRTVGDCAP